MVSPVEPVVDGGTTFSPRIRDHPRYIQHWPFERTKKMSLVFAEKRNTKHLNFSVKYDVGVSIVARCG